LISFEADLQLQKKIYFSAPNSVHWPLGWAMRNFPIKQV
jgi:hypothetical protein